MKRIKHRKFGRTADSIQAASATHRIVIGFDARKPGADRSFPGKLRGFLIVRDSIGPDGAPIIDQPCMQRLGVSTEAIAEAKTKQLKAPDGLLPQSLQFVLMSDARRTADGWEYPGTFGEAFECWNKNGLFCTGDGETFSRKREDGGRDHGECRPMGKDDDPPYCQYSVSGECKGHSRLILCLVLDNRESGPRFLPLDPMAGLEARFRFDSSSGYNPQAILAELDRAADRLNGRIAGISGRLTFAVRKRRSPQGVGIVGQVTLALSEIDIYQREQQLYQERLAERGISAPGHAPLLIQQPMDVPLEPPRQIAAPDDRARVDQQLEDALEDGEIEDGDGAADDEWIEPDEVDAEQPPEPAPLTVESASDDELGDALWRYCLAMGAGVAADAEAVLSELASFKGKKSGKAFAITNIGWFFADDEHMPGADRLKYLRRVCGKLAENPEFELLRIGAGEATS